MHLIVPEHLGVDSGYTCGLMFDITLLRYKFQGEYLSCINKKTHHQTNVCVCTAPLYIQQNSHREELSSEAALLHMGPL
jgi:hypothetical protein